MRLVPDNVQQQVRYKVLLFIFGTRNHLEGYRESSLCRIPWCENSWWKHIKKSLCRKFFPEFLVSVIR